MCKIFNKLFVVGMVLLSACAQSKDEPSQPPTAGETQTVQISLTRGVQDDFLAAGVENYTIYIYRNTKADKSLFSEQQVSVNQNTVSLSFSLGDNFKIFAVANASVTGKENFETLELHIDPLSDSQVWMTEVTSFTSDKSVTTLDMSMQRLVARVEFAPAESDQELSSQTLFDTLKLNFSNTADTYKVCDGSVTTKNQELTLNGESNYKGGFYTFSTTSAGSDSMLDITFLKNGAVVNKSAGTLETGTKYSANNRYKMSVPVLANDYVETPWTRSPSSSSKQIFKLDVTSL